MPGLIRAAEIAQSGITVGDGRAARATSKQSSDALQQKHLGHLTSSAIVDADEEDRFFTHPRATFVEGMFSRGQGALPPIVLQRDPTLFRGSVALNLIVAGRSADGDRSYDRSRCYAPRQIAVTTA